MFVACFSQVNVNQGNRKDEANSSWRWCSIQYPLPSFFSLGVVCSIWIFTYQSFGPQPGIVPLVLIWGGLKKIIIKDKVVCTKVGTGNFEFSCYLFLAILILVNLLFLGMPQFLILYQCLLSWLVKFDVCFSPPQQTYKWTKNPDIAKCGSRNQGYC